MSVSKQITYFSPSEKLNNTNSGTTQRLKNFAFPCFYMKKENNYPLLLFPPQSV